MNSDLIGTRLGQYELAEIIRHGGMSTVYKAYQPSLNRYVAVKVLAQTSDPQFVERFKREAHSIAQLQHPNIVPVFDYGEQDGILYLVVQYIEGGVTLADTLGNPLHPAEALKLTGRVLAGLEYAHKKGVIHRDIKPGNVLMPSPNWPVIADFGIAKLMNNEASKTLTDQGIVVGTAAYMAPEQAFGLPVDARTDLYSTGVVLYELVTGRVPFDAATPMAVITKHAYEPPPPARSINPNLPAEIEVVLSRALAKDRSERYQSAAEMAEEVESVAALLERPRAENQLAELYRSGVQAFEEGRWELAVERLTRVASVSPEYEDVTDLLAAAREEQARAKTEARQRLDEVHQRRQSSIGYVAATPPVTSSEPASPATTEPVTAPPPVAQEAPPSIAESAPAAAPATEPSALQTATLEEARTSGSGKGSRLKPGSRRLALVAAVTLGVALLAGAALFGSSLLGRQGDGPVAGLTAGASASATAAVVAGGGLDTAFGSVRFHDQAAILDEVTVAVKGMPQPPAGKQYEAWLLGQGGEDRHTIGVLTLDANGSGEVSLVDAERQNLLARYDGFEITAEPASDSNPLPEGEIAYAGAVPSEALAHVRHLLVSFEQTPGETALATGLLAQTEALSGYVQVMIAEHGSDLAGMKRDAEAVVNLIEGKNGQNYGDADGDGVVTTQPAEEFGLLLNGKNIGYIQGTIEHAQNAARAQDATDNVKLHADHVVASAKNLGDWAVQIRDMCLTIARSQSVDAAREEAGKVAALADRLLNGKDLNGNESVDPVSGEGGAKTAYQHAQYLSDISVRQGPGTVASSGSSNQTTPSATGQVDDYDGPMLHDAATQTAGAPASPTQAAQAAAPATDTPAPAAPTQAVAPKATTVAPVEPTAIVASGPPPAGTLVFEDNFDAGPGKSGLEDEGKGKASSRGFHPPGVYHFILSRPEEMRHVVLPRFAIKDFTVELDLWDNSDEYAGSMSTGVIFRVRDREHFYALLIDPRGGEYTVRKYEAENKWSELIPWSPSARIKEKAEVNHLRVDADGDKFSISLNGEPLDNFTDGSYGLGMIGMITVNIDANSPHAHFDNLKVWSRDPAAEPVPPQTREHPAGTMLLVPGGEFIMGSNERSDEWTHVAQIANFFIDRTEVTNAAYASCVQAGKCISQRSPASETHPGYANQERFAQFPAIHVSWEQARDFCAWAGKRLPTEAEWERAASWNPSSREKVEWPWGNVFEAARLNSLESGNGDTTAAGRFAPELNGTFDMAGNVWEWTSSLFRPYPYNSSDGREEAQAQGDRVFRGGSWAQTLGKARTFVRQSAAPTYADREIGFRCAANP